MVTCTIALGPLLSLSPLWFSILHFFLKLESYSYPFRGSLCFMLCSSHCQQCSTVGRDGVCKSLFETCFTQVLSEGLFQASAAQEMLSQTSREELGPCLLHMQGFSQDRWQLLRLLLPGHSGSAGRACTPMPPNLLQERSIKVTAVCLAAAHPHLPCCP